METSTVKTATLFSYLAWNIRLVIRLLAITGRIGNEQHELPSKRVNSVITNWFCLLILLSVAQQSYAQAVLELAPGSASLGNGPTTASQTATFLNNTDNPTGNTFAAYTPALTVTASLSNQQFNATSTGNAGMVFGGTVPAPTGSQPPAAPIFPALNYICATASNTAFTSAPNQPGTGISSVTNSGFWLFLQSKFLVGKSSNQTQGYYYGDLTFTFSRPVDNPILHVSDIGSYLSTPVSGFTSYYKLQTPGVTMSMLSGSNLTVTATEFRETTLATAACQFGYGSILLTGTGITAVTFKVYILDDGSFSSWPANSAGDGLLLGFSVVEPLETLSGTASVTPPTCSLGVANADGALTLTSYSSGVTRVGFSAGSAYSGPVYASAVGVTAAPMVLANNLPNPVSLQPYTIRLFKDATTYSDVLVSLDPAVCATSDLSLSVSPPTTSANKGEQVIYTFTLTNAGPDPASGVTACIAIPNNTTFLSATASQGTYDSGTTIWDVGTVPIGTQTITLTLQMK